MRLALLLLALILAPAVALAQGALLQGGPFTAGHSPMYQNGVAALQDSGSANGNSPNGSAGAGLSELLQFNRVAGSGTGTGPFGTHDCHYANTASASGGGITSPYTYLCLDALAQGGGLITFGSGGGAPLQNLNVMVNGVMQPVPGSIGGVPSLASTSTLQATASSFSAMVVRQDATPGLGAPPLYYRPSGAPCTLNAGAGDGGSQIPTSDGKCWLAIFPPGPMDVREWGADPTGATSAVAAITAADATANALGREVYFAGGTYNLPTCIAPLTGAYWHGDGRDRAFLASSSATNCSVIINNPAVQLRDLGFTSSVTKTSGSTITVASNDVKLLRLNMIAPWTGITLNTGTITLMMDDVEVINNIGDGIVINNCLNCRAIHLFVASAPSPVAPSSMKLLNLGDFSCISCSLIGANINLWIHPGNGQVVASFKWSEGFLDHAVSENLRADPTTGGQFLRSNFDGTWFGSAPANNIDLIPATGAAVDGITFSNCEAYIAAAGSGLVVIGPAANISWIGGKIAGNFTGVFINNATFVTIADALIGATSSIGANTNLGISVGGTSDYIDIHDNQKLTTNPSPFILFVASGLHSRVHDNPGFNPTGPVTVTVGTSPFAVPNTLFSATLYCYGGNVTSVSQNGVVIVNAVGSNAWNATFGPNDVITITHSGAPTCQSIQH